MGTQGNTTESLQSKTDGTGEHKVTEKGAVHALSDTWRSKNSLSFVIVTRRVWEEKDWGNCESINSRCQAQWDTEVVSARLLWGRGEGRWEHTITYHNFTIRGRKRLGGFKYNDREMETLIPCFILNTLLISLLVKFKKKLFWEIEILTTQIWSLSNCQMIAHKIYKMNS